MPKTGKIIAVIPAYNEESRIGNVINGVLGFVDKAVVVNDASGDNTSIVSRDKGACVIDLPENKGVGFATRVGCEHALSLGAEIIVTIDADGQHDPRDIPKLIEPIINGEAGIAFGIRPRDKRMPLAKRIANALLYLVTKVTFSSDIKDPLTGFHAFTKDCYHRLSLESSGYEIVVEFVYKTLANKIKHKQAIVETIYNNKDKGMKKRHGFKVLIFILKWRARGPGRAWIF